MKLLTLDTSTTACSVALTVNEQLIAEYMLNLSGRQSTRIMEAVDTVLRHAGVTIKELDGFGVALGPGSFTGLRVGLATVKGLALASGKPVAGFSSLAMLAMNLPFSAVPVCPLFDARKKEVYAGLYRWDDGPVPVFPDCVLPPALFLERLTGPVVFVGEGAVAYRDLIIRRLGEKAQFAPFPNHQPSAARGAFLAARAFARGETIPLRSLAPGYIRLSEAELAKMSKDLL